MDFFINNPTASSLNWPSIISSTGAVLVGIIAIYYSYRQFSKTIKSKIEEEKRQDIYKQLNEFYGPLLQLRKKSNLLYTKFRASFIQEHPNFSTLTYLLNNGAISGNEKVLLDEIINIGIQCEKLIHEKSGLIGDDNLRNNVLPRVTAHFLVLRLAYQNILIGEPDKYQDLVFPRDLDSILEKRVQKLEGLLK